MRSAGRPPLDEFAAEVQVRGGLEGTQPEVANDERTLVPYLQLLWVRRAFLFKTACYALLLSVLTAFLIPVRYQASTRLMPPDGDSTSGLGVLAALTGGGRTTPGSTGLGGLAGLAGDVLGVKSSGALFVGVLGSETVQDALIKKFELMKVYRDSKIEDARKDLTSRTELEEDRKSGIIVIRVTDHDAKRATAMAQTYVSELDRVVAQVSTSSARRERIFLEGRLDRVKVDLDTAAKQFSDFSSKNTAIDIPEQAKAMVEAAAALQGQLIAAQSEVEGLKQIYTDNNVRVRSAEARVDELNKKLDEIGGGGVDGVKSSSAPLYPSIRQLPILGVTYAELFRESKIQEALYELLTQQYELAKVEEAKEIPTVKVLDPAVVPTKKSFPPRLAIAILGTMLAIAMAVSWVIGKAQWDAVESNDPRKMLAAEVIGTVQGHLRRVSRSGVVPAGEKQAPSSGALETLDTNSNGRSDARRGAV